jgi:hypothetical protein
MVLRAVAVTTGGMDIRDSQNIKQTKLNLNIDRWKLEQALPLQMSVILLGSADSRSTYSCWN